MYTSKNYVCRIFYILHIHKTSWRNGTRHESQLSKHWTNINFCRFHFFNGFYQSIFLGPFLPSPLCIKDKKGTSNISFKWIFFLREVNATDHEEVLKLDKTIYIYHVYIGYLYCNWSFYFFSSSHMLFNLSLWYVLENIRKGFTSIPFLLRSYFFSTFSIFFSLT